MKSKKWLISLGLAVVLVVSFALPACNGEPTEYWHTPIADGDEKISFDITTLEGPYHSVAQIVAEDLRDLGLDVTVKTMDSGTFFDYLYAPPEGKMQAFVFKEDPSPDPWSDWIWGMYTDPLTTGEDWNPTWYHNPDFDAVANAVEMALNLSAKEEMLLSLQETLAEDLPVIMLVRDELITVVRTDNWVNWYNTMGGPVTWINDYSLREVTQVGDATQLNIGTLELMDSLAHYQSGLMWTNAGCLYLMIVYENLAGYPKLDGDPPQTAYEFAPQLATNFSVSYESDGEGGQNQVWTIDLREGVKWHDGENFTADDVIFTMKYVEGHWSNTKPINWTAVEANEWEPLPDHVLVEKINDYQVEWRYIEDYHQNEDYFRCVYLWFAMSPEHVFGLAGNGTYDGWKEDPRDWDGEYIGTGPYKVEEFEAGNYLLLERNGSYWGAGVEDWGLPEPQRILFRQYTDSGTMFMALEAGDIDTVMAHGAPFAKYDAYVADEDIEVETVPNLSLYYMGFNLHPTAGYAPLQDLALREAIAAAINKQRIVEMAFGEFAETVDSWIYPESQFYHPALPNNEYDTTEATNILLAAGYTFHE